MEFNSHPNANNYDFSPQERVPFAVVGSNTIIEGEGGKKSRGRKYPWGVVDIENLQHCDFLPLRNMLIKVGFFTLKTEQNKRA